MKKNSNFNIFINFYKRIIVISLFIILSIVGIILFSILCDINSSIFVIFISILSGLLSSTVFGLFLECLDCRKIKNDIVLLLENLKIDLDKLYFAEEQVLRTIESITNKTTILKKNFLVSEYGNISFYLQRTFISIGSLKNQRNLISTSLISLLCEIEADLINNQRFIMFVVSNSCGDFNETHILCGCLKRFIKVIDDKYLLKRCSIFFD